MRGPSVPGTRVFEGQFVSGMTKHRAPVLAGKKNPPG